MVTDEKQFVTVKEASIVLEISKPSIYELIREGKMPHHVFPNNRIRIHVGDLQRFIDEARVVK